jgi:hypothetical protein
MFGGITGTIDQAGMSGKGDSRRFQSKRMITCWRSGAMLKGIPFVPIW